MTEKNIGQHDVAEPTPGGVELEAFVDGYVGLFSTGVRTPVLERPSDYGMEFEDLSFPSMDGVPLDAWFIPTDSDKLLIITTP